MKKLSFLVLILGAASIANAYINSPMKIVSLGSGEYGIELINGMSSTMDDQGGYWLMAGVNPNSGALAPTLPPILNDSYISPDSPNGVMGRFGTTSISPSWTAASGIYADSFTTQINATTLYLYTLDDSMVQATLVDTFIIPEPATIALLCLGGLMLRRRK
jgi:hypothetical protein